MVDIYYEGVACLDFDAAFYDKWFSKVVHQYGKELGNLCLIFCNDDYLIDINREHLGHDYYTDIITFNFNQDDVVSGDLYISIDRIKENAADLFVDWKIELNRVCIHGVLHLLGLNDKSPEEQDEMRKAEDRALLYVSRET